MYEHFNICLTVYDHQISALPIVKSKDVLTLLGFIESLPCNAIEYYLELELRMFPQRNATFDRDRSVPNSSLL